VSDRNVKVTVWFGATSKPPLRLTVPGAVKKRLEQHYRNGSNQKVTVPHEGKNVEIDFSKVSRLGND
jgi:hypothetical protein